MNYTGLISGFLVLIVAIGVNASIEYPSDNQSEEYSLYLITGQSNAEYALGVNVEEVNQTVAKIPYGSAYYFGNPEGQVSKGSTDWRSQIQSWDLYPMNDASGNWIVGGYEAPLAQHIYAADPDHKVIILNTGWGGASISNSLPSYEQNDLTRDAVSSIKAKVGCELKDVFWIQGESDASMSASNYEYCFTKMWKSYQKLGFESICISLMPSKYVGSHDAQLELAGHNNVYIGSTVAESFTTDAGTLYSDNLHYTQKGRLLIADQFNEWLNSHESTGKSDSTVMQIVGIVPIILCVAFIVGIAASIYMRRE